MKDIKISMLFLSTYATRPIRSSTLERNVVGGVNAAILVKQARKSTTEMYQFRTLSWQPTKDLGNMKNMASEMAKQVSTENTCGSLPRSQGGI